MKRKNWKRLLPLALCLVLLAAVLAGCSSGRAYDNNTEASYPGRAPSFGESGGAGAPVPDTAPSEPKTDGKSSPFDSSGAITGDGNVSDEKLIRNVYLQGETRNFEEALTGIKNAVQSMGGYIESATEYGKKPQVYGDSGRNASIVARVPAEKLDAFISATGGLIDIISQTSNVTNVTTQYYDYEARKKTYEIQLQRLESILTEASELSDILALETEIARVRYELESIETILRNLDNQVGYSTVSIEFYELTAFERPQATEQSLGERIYAAFAQSLKDTGVFLQDLLVWISGNIIGLLILAAVVVFIVRLVRRYNARHGYEPRKNRRAGRQKATIEPRTEAQPQEQKPGDDAPNKQ